MVGKASKTIIPLHHKPSLEIEHAEIAMKIEIIYSCTYFSSVQVEETTLAARTSFMLLVLRMIVGVTFSVPAGNASYINTTQK